LATSLQDFFKRNFQARFFLKDFLTNFNLSLWNKVQFFIFQKQNKKIKGISQTLMKYGCKVSAFHTSKIFKTLINYQLNLWEKNRLFESSTFGKLALKSNRAKLY
jgi:hypothetical protein